MQKELLRISFEDAEGIIEGNWIRPYDNPLVLL